MKKVKIFDDYSATCVSDMNDFIKNVDVVNIKMNTVVVNTGNLFTKYLVIYKEKEENKC